MQIWKRAVTFLDLASGGRRVDAVASKISATLIALAVAQTAYELFVAVRRGAFVGNAVWTLVMTALAVVALRFVWQGSFAAHIFAAVTLVSACATNTISFSYKDPYIGIHFHQVFDAGAAVFVAILWLSIMIIAAMFKGRSPDESVKFPDVTPTQPT